MAEKRIRLVEYGQNLSDLEQAGQIGEALCEDGAILDFSEVEEISPDFLTEVLAVFLEHHDQVTLTSAVDFATVPQTMFGVFMNAQQAASMGRRPSGENNPSSVPVSSFESGNPQPPEEVMNPFAVLQDVQQDYLTYVRTFQRFQNPEIQNWVLDQIQNGTLLWKPPYVQLAHPFAMGDRLQELVDEGILHPDTPKVFRRIPEDLASGAVHPYRHQTQAVRKVLAGRNVIVATGTGSGKSFSFGMPIVSDALRDLDRKRKGIKAVIVYPMNALANSQYDDFARRLHGSGLRIALYTGDTASSPGDALSRYRINTGRQQPYDSEVLSREEIQHNPPDILMTNYVMLELLLTRFEDRKLFAHEGVLQYLVLDEVHTYSGKRGADVAALVRRLKQHTHTIGNLRCIGTSATVESGEKESAAEAIVHFASELFGETFETKDVVTETYASLSQDLEPQQQQIVELLRDRQLSIAEIAQKIGASHQEAEELLLSLPGLPPKLHAFFSQGRAISACLDVDQPHLNDRGEVICPVCADAGKKRVTFPLVF